MFLAACLLAGALIVPKLPHDHRILLELEDPRDVIGVEIEWAPAEGGEAIRSSSFRFGAAEAPHTITAPLRVPNGEYALDARILRRNSTESLRRVVRVSDAESILVHLR